MARRPAGAPFVGRDLRSAARPIGHAAAGAGVALGGLYAYQTTKVRRTAAHPFRLPDPPAPGSAEFGRLIEGLAGAPVRPGNRVQVLRNGCQTFPAMLEAIAAATETIDFSCYIYWPGGITEQFTDAFCERASAGVEVNVLLDAWGSARHDPRQVDRLERAGARVAFFRTPRWYTLDKLNHRMHRRLLVVDGRVGFTGGVGIADVWTGDAQDPEHWRETDVLVEGPAVRDVLGAFVQNWTQWTRRILSDRHFPDLDDASEGVRVQVTRSSPTGGVTTAGQLFYSAIAGVRERLWLTTAYFTAGPMFMGALADAARRGVDVRLLLNGPNIDKELVRETAQRAYGPLLEAGVRIFEYQPTMLHAKVLIADGWSNVGSSNFDERSFALDTELNLSFGEGGPVGELEKQFLEDLERSEELDLARWRRRPLRNRVRGYVGQLARQSF